MSLIAYWSHERGHIGNTISYDGVGGLEIDDETEVVEDIWRRNDWSSQSSHCRFSLAVLNVVVRKPADGTQALLNKHRWLNIQEFIYMRILLPSFLFVVLDGEDNHECRQ